MMNGRTVLDMVKDCCNYKKPLDHQPTFQEKAMDELMIRTEDALRQLEDAGLIIPYGCVKLADGTIVSKEEVVATVNGQAFIALDEAIATIEPGAHTEIYIQKDMDGNGVALPENSDIIIDFGGHVFDIDGELVGSTGTKTLGFQFLKGSNVTLRNGILVSKKAKMMIQNYANLTLENIVLDGTQMPAPGMYVLSNNCGTVNLVGDTSIIAAPGNFAMDVCYKLYDVYKDGVFVTVKTTGNIVGKIEYTSKGTVAETTEFSLLAIEDGHFQGEFAIDADGANVQISGGRFTADPSAFLAEGKEVAFVNGVYVVA
jgi:hypothetical protein